MIKVLSQVQDRKRKLKIKLINYNSSMPISKMYKNLKKLNQKTQWIDLLVIIPMKQQLSLEKASRHLIRIISQN